MTPKGLWKLGRFYLKKHDLFDKVNLELVKNKGFHGRCRYYVNYDGPITSKRNKVLYGLGPATDVTIQLSLHNLLTMPFAEVKDTVLHEIAHAIDALENGDSSHGKRWKLIAKSVGARPKARSAVSGNHQYVVVCNDCGTRLGGRHRLTRSIKIKIYDGKCGICKSDNIKMIDTIAKKTVVDNDGIYEPYLIK